MKIHEKATVLYRKQFPVAMIESVRYWIFTGPEASGKTSLARYMAALTGLPLVEEQVRELAEQQQRDTLPPGLEFALPDFSREKSKQGSQEYLFTATQVLALAELQFAAEHLRSIQMGHPLILDTDLLTYLVWYTERHGPPPRHWAGRLQRRRGAHYLLCRPDLPWEPDPMRSNPDDRDRLFDVYRHQLEALGLKYSIVEGREDARRLSARRIFGY